MTRRDWLRHPPRTIGRPIQCPTRLPRFRTIHDAREALRYGFGNHPLTAWPCSQCDGAHITDRSNP